MAGEQVAVKVGGVVTEYAVDDFIANAGTSPKLVYDATGTLVWSPHNMFVNSATPATQDVTLIVGATYTMEVTGTGSLAGSSGASGTASAGSPATFTATGTTGTFTLTGSLTTIQLNRGTVATDYLATGASARCGLAFTHNPATLAPRGILAEPAATNLALQASDFTSASWTKSNMTTALTATGPTGVANSASTLTATAGNATALQAITSASASRITSVFIKRRTGTGNIDLTQDNGTTWATQTITSSWARYSIAAVTSTNPTVGIRIVTSGDAVDVFIFQHESGAGATVGVTSPIPTFGVTVTRAADNYNFLLSAIPALGAEYSIYGRFSSFATNPNTNVVSITDGTSANYAGLRVASSQVRINVQSGGVAQAALSGGSYTSDTIVSAAARVKQNDFAISLSGGSVATDTAGNIPVTPNKVVFGSNTGITALSVWHLEKMVIVPRAWNNTELTTKSAA